MRIGTFKNFENNLKGIEIQTKKSITRIGLNTFSIKEVKRYLPITDNKFIFLKDYLRHYTTPPTRVIEFRFLIFQFAIKYL